MLKNKLKYDKNKLFCQTVIISSLKSTKYQSVTVKNT